MIKKIIGLIIPVILISGCVSKQEWLETKYEQGKKDFIQKKYREAFEELQPVAEAGNADSQYALGYMYFYGKGILENKERARYWMNLSAQSGNQQAKNAMKMMNK